MNVVLNHIITTIQFILSYVCHNNYDTTIILAQKTSCVMQLLE